jgi:hypothetical protein
VGSPRTKGAVVREFLKWYAHQQPAGALARVYRDVPAHLRVELDPDAEALGVLPSSWYESAVIHALIEAVQQQLPPRERDAILAEGVRAGMHASAKGVYRWILRALTPELYARNIQRFWNLMHDTGVREIVMTSKTSAISTTSDWAGHHPALCASTVHAMAAILELTGCKNVIAERTACVSDGAPACVAKYSWTR